MSVEATLQLEHDGKSNVLRIHRGTVDGAVGVVVDFCKGLPKNRNDADFDFLNRLDVNRIAQSTDFICPYVDCGYHHKSESRYILHARSHFVFEVSPDAVCDTVFKFANEKYMCSKCPRSTTDWIAFREHIRHHVFEKPYKCSVCLVDIPSVPKLRIHFQKSHAGRETDFLFNGNVYELNTLLSMLLPFVSAVPEPVNISFKLPENMTMRISSTSVPGETHPVGLMRQMLSPNQQATKRQEPHVADKSAAVEMNPVVHMPGKYVYSRGVYKCLTCCYTARSEAIFVRHVWKHVHGSWNSVCFHNTNGALSTCCAVVSGLMNMLKKVAELTRAVDSLSVTSVRETVASANSRAPEAAVLAETGEYYISCSYKYWICANTVWCPTRKFRTEVDYYWAVELCIGAGKMGTPCSSWVPHRGGATVMGDVGP